jgi:hypothetical protein
MAVQEGSWEKSDDLLQYFKPNEGANIFRVASNPVTTYSHWVRTAPSGKNQKLSCPGKDTCPVCKAGVDLLIRNCFLILDRSSNSVKLYEAPQEVFKTIKANAQDEEYGDVTTYDFKLIRTGVKFQTKYQVIPSPKPKPLTDEENQKVDEAKGKLDWNKMYPPKTLDELQSIVENFSPDFVEEVKEKQAEKARFKASKEGGTAPQRPVAETQTVAASKPAAKPVAVQDESEFFDNEAEKDIDLNSMDWGTD